jgi:hypothetical protein
MSVILMVSGLVCAVTNATLLRNCAVHGLLLVVLAVALAASLSILAHAMTDILMVLILVPLCALVPFVPLARSPLAFLPALLSFHQPLLCPPSHLGPSLLVLPDLPDLLAHAVAMVHPDLKVTVEQPLRTSLMFVLTSSTPPPPSVWMYSL